MAAAVAVVAVGDDGAGPSYTVDRVGTSWKVGAEAVVEVDGELCFLWVVWRREEVRPPARPHHACPP